nr:MAG TPA: hypothetical protein [Caudoviricetes sp.]
MFLDLNQPLLLTALGSSPLSLYNPSCFSFSHLLVLIIFQNEMYVNMKYHEMKLLFIAL